MLAPSYQEHPVQAMPIHTNTFYGTAADESATDKNVIHIYEDDNLTFKFKDGSEKTIPCPAGWDVALAPDVVSVSSQHDILMS